MNISFLKEKNKKYFIYGLLALLVVVLLIPTNTEKEEIVQEESVAEDELESRLEKILSSMEGVGKVEVMIMKGDVENSIFSEIDEKEISGVVVVAEGAGSASVNAQITEVVKALFSIDAHKISIVKMRLQEE